jgi:hypothetical protein
MPEGRVSHRMTGWMAGAALLAALAATTANAQEEAAAETTAAVTSGDVEGRLESITEQLQTIQTDTDRLKRFKFSGYVQARWETAENSTEDTVAVSGTTFTPPNLERFFIRRARLKLTYDASPLSQAVVYIDGGQDRTIRLLEAYLTLLDPWTPLHSHQLTAGQFNIPYGYEIERSSSVRELPERSRAENVLFPGERDRGIKLVDQWSSRLETVVAVINGGGIGQSAFPNSDPTRAKDVVARARWSQGWFDVAASGYWGETLIPVAGPDVRLDRTRLGFDAQLYYELPGAGGGSLRGELYDGENPVGAVSADFLGWYAMWVQNLGEKLQLAARYEEFDPSTDLAHDQFERVSLGVNAFYDGFTRITVAYDIPTTEPASTGFRDPKDNLWTVQFQHRF